LYPIALLNRTTEATDVVEKSASCEIFICETRIGSDKTQLAIRASLAWKELNEFLISPKRSLNLLPGDGTTADLFVIRTSHENNLQEILDMVKIIAQIHKGQGKNGNELALFKRFSDAV
jgi:hypothetical protein